MSDVTGPISTLPGARHSAPEGVMCDDHPDRPAAGRVQGETDSMGCEMHDLCAECIEQWRADIAAAREEARNGMCEWCKLAATDLRQRRDFEEGSSGRIYMVCGKCVEAELKRLREEWAESDDFGRRL